MKVFIILALIYNASALCHQCLFKSQQYHPPKINIHPKLTIDQLIRLTEFHGRVVNKPPKFQRPLPYRPSNTYSSPSKLPFSPSRPVNSISRPVNSYGAPLPPSNYYGVPDKQQLPQNIFPSTNRLPLIPTSKPFNPTTSRPVNSYGVPLPPSTSYGVPDLEPEKQQLPIKPPTGFKNYVPPSTTTPSPITTTTTTEADYDYQDQNPESEGTNEGPNVAISTAVAGGNWFYLQQPDGRLQKVLLEKTKQPNSKPEEYIANYYFQNVEEVPQGYAPLVTVGGYQES